MPTRQLFALIIFSVGISILIVRGFSWIKKNRDKHPHLYANLGLIRFIAWLTLNLPDSF